MIHLTMSNLCVLRSTPTRVPFHVLFLRSICIAKINPSFDARYTFTGVHFEFIPNVGIRINLTEFSFREFTFNRCYSFLSNLLANVKLVKILIFIFKCNTM